VTQLKGPWIDSAATQSVMAMLTDAGFEAWFVGGCVRNALMGVPVSDIDITTNARPERVIELARAAGLKAIPTGIDHGTVTVVAAGVPYEITTFRRDVETHGRHAVVAFADTVSEDAHRRDFTINALYASADGTVTDPLGGLEDLKARRLRFIDDPAQRIQEDYLRILRFFRFHAWYGDDEAGMDADGLAACAEFAGGIESLSRERVGAEFGKLLRAPDPGMALAAMEQSTVLSRIWPGGSVRALLPLLHLETLSGVAPRGMRRLVALGGVAEPADLRLSKKQCKQVALLRELINAGQGAAEMAYRFGADTAWDVTLLGAAMIETPVATDAGDQIALGQVATFPVRAADLMDQFQGVALGDELRRLEARWIKSGFELGRDALLA
jgi:poly(A) polymerase